MSPSNRPPAGGRLENRNPDRNREHSRRACLRRAAATAAAALALAPAGCGYSLRPPFQENIRTVHVPVFRTVNSFRRDFNLRVTEAVIKEIERSTPYKVVGSPENADYILEGEVVLVDKNAVLQNPNNLPRAIDLIVTISVAFFPNFGNPEPTRAEDAERVRLTENVKFYPELGETVALALDKEIENLARRVVGNIEFPW